MGHVTKPPLVQVLMGQAAITERFCLSDNQDCLQCTFSRDAENARHEKTAPNCRNKSLS